MKHSIAIILTAITICGCTNLNGNYDNQATSNNSEPVHLAIIVDGTDVIDNQSVVPIINERNLLLFADSVSSISGSIYLTYVDRNSSNNTPVIFEFSKKRPIAPIKLSYMQVSEYKKLYNRYEKDSTEYVQSLMQNMEEFEISSKELLNMAYDTSVAKQVKGSDIYGAISSCTRYLESVEEGKKYIILFSDGRDNVGNQIPSISNNTELILVNGTGENNLETNAKTLFSCRQAMDYCFK